MMFPILKLPCPKPSKPGMGANFAGRVPFHWHPGDTALYQLEFQRYEDDSVVFVTDTLSDTSFVLTDSLAPDAMVNGRYNVRLRKACDYMESPYHTVVWSDWSEPRQFVYTHRPVGIEAVETAVDFMMKPNPAKGTVTVETGESGHATIEVVDMEGRVALTQLLNHSATQPLTLDISALAPGVYLVRLSTPEGTAVRKLTAVK